MICLHKYMNKCVVACNICAQQTVTFVGNITCPPDRKLLIKLIYCLYMGSAAGILYNHTQIPVPSYKHKQRVQGRIQGGGKLHGTPFDRAQLASNYQLMSCWSVFLNHYQPRKHITATRSHTATSLHMFHC